MGDAADLDVSLRGRSQVDVYLSRGDLPVPSDNHLRERHPVTGQTLSEYIVFVASGKNSVPSFPDSGASEVVSCWVDFLKRLSW